MPYVRRGADGALTSLHRLPEGGASEFLPDDDPAVQAFVGRGYAGAAGSGFARLDAEFIRVLEDLIDVLIRGRVINVTDLPADAQKKLYSRKGHRQPSALSDLNLLGDQPTGDNPLDTDLPRFT